MAKAVSVYQYEQPRCPDGWNESERRFYARLVETLDDIYSKYGRIDEKLLSRNFVDTVNSAPDRAISALENQYASASVDSLYANSLTAQTANIVRLVVERMVADTIVADHLTAGSVEATFAYMVSLSAKFGAFDFETVQNLVSQAMVLERGSAEELYIKNLAVLYAQVLNATIGTLCIRASDGNYYQIDVSQDENGEPSVRANAVSVRDDEIVAGQTDNGRIILGTNILAENLSAGSLSASDALVNSILAAKIDVDTLVARSAFIQNLTSSESFIDRLFAETAFIKALTTKRIIGDQSIEMIVGNVDASARIFRQEDAPGGGDGVKNGDLWVIPSTGQTWQATALEALGLRFAVDGDGNLCYEIDGDAEGYSLYLDGADLRAEGFAFPLDADGIPGAPYVWALVRDAELERNADAAANRANEALDIANAALSQADFQRVIRQDVQGLHVGDNKTGFEVLIDSASVNVMSDGEALSTFSDKYVRLDNMQIHKVRGGLAISVYNGRR